MTVAIKESVSSKIWNAFDRSASPFLWDWRLEVAQTKPYKGINVYHNIPLSIETCCKVEALCVAGANVVVRNTDFVTPASYPEAIEFVNAMGLEIRQEKYAAEGEFDFYLDCCAELSDLTPPKSGAVELTRTGAMLYESKGASYPIISVDDSYLKALETFNGTGDAFIRSFVELTDRNLSRENIALVGYGKVGQGIAYAAKKAGAGVVIFDIDPEARHVASSHGFEAYPCGDGSHTLKALENTSVVVTATGRRNILQKAFPEVQERLAGKVLCNMGAIDEIGPGFTESEVVAGGVCMNFTLRHPTTMRYLDPSFYAHNLSVQVLQEGAFEPGFHPFPSELDRPIVERWAEIHKESVDHILP